MAGVVRAEGLQSLSAGRLQILRQQVETTEGGVPRDRPPHLAPYFVEGPEPGIVDDPDPDDPDPPGVVDGDADGGALTRPNATVTWSPGLMPWTAGGGKRTLIGPSTV